MVSTEDFRIIGAKKLLLDGLGIKCEDSLLIFSDERLQSCTKYVINAAEKLGIKDTLLVLNSNEFRPREHAPKSLLKAIEGSDKMLYFFDRIPEETPPGTKLPYRKEISQVLKENNVWNIGLYDCKPWYFNQGGIYADYNAIEDLGKNLFKLFKGCTLVEITSDIGTNVSFKLNEKDIIQGAKGVRYRGPSIELTREHDPTRISVQAPEAEGGCPPLMNSVNGKIVIDGAITGLGEPPVPIVLTYKEGNIVQVEGDSVFLNEMRDFIRRLTGKKPENLLLLDHIDEFSIGFNKWAKFDDNISNCEKVAGSAHFGIGHGSMIEGPGHGEYFDMMLKYPTIKITQSNGKILKVIEKGKIQM